MPSKNEYAKKIPIEVIEFRNKRKKTKIELEHIRYDKFNGIGRKKNAPLLLGLCVHRLGVWHGESI